MQKRVWWSVSPLVLLISLNPSAFAQDPACGEDGSPTAPLSTTILAPLKSATQKMKTVDLKMDASLQSHVPKTALVDFTTDFFKALNDSANPDHEKALANAAAADSVFEFITSGTIIKPIHPAPIQPGGPIHYFPFLSISPPVEIMPTEQPPKTVDELQAFLKKQQLSPQATLYLISKFTAKLSDRYGVDPAQKPVKNLHEALEKTFQALLNRKNDAGICGPIHVFGAFVADSLGMKDACTMGADWSQKRSTTVAHVVTCFRDPQSKKFYWLNYDDLSRSSSNFLSEAAQEQAINMSPISTSVTVETHVFDDHSHIHQMQGNRSRELMKNVHAVADVDAPGVAIQAGTLQNSIAVQKKIVGSAQNKAGVFAVGTETRTELPLQMGVAGVFGRASVQKELSKHLTLNGTVDGEVGGFVVHDETPKGNIYSDKTRTDSGLLMTGHGESDVAWKSERQQGKVGIEAKYDQLIHVSKYGTGAGQPYNSLTAQASEKVKDIEVHANSSAYYYISGMWKPIPAKPTLIPAYQNVGVTTTHTAANGKLLLKNSADGYIFGAVNSGAYGLRDEVEASYTGNHNLTYTVRGEAAKNINHSNDVFYDADSTGKVQLNVAKKFDRAILSLGFKRALNEHRIFNSMQEGSIPQGLSTTEPKTAGSLNINF